MNPMRDRSYRNYSNKNFLIYCNEIAQADLLTKEEEADLSHHIRTASPSRDKARERLINSNLRLVVKIAKEYKNYGMDMMDLVSEGNIGLMKSVDRFDGGRDVKFSTYASFWIKQSIRTALSNKSRLIRLPAHLVQLQSNIFKFISGYELDTGGEPTQQKIAESLGLPEKKVELILGLQALNKPLLLDVEMWADSDKQKSDSIEDFTAKNPAKEAEKEHDFQVLRELIQKLDEREKYIIEHRFGIKQIDTQTLEKIGRKFKISRERIRQIEFIALKKLRSMMTKKMRINFRGFYLTKSQEAGKVSLWK